MEGVRIGGSSFRNVPDPHRAEGDVRGKHRGEVGFSDAVISLPLITGNCSEGEAEDASVKGVARVEACSAEGV